MVRDRVLSSKKGAGMAMNKFVGIMAVVIIIIVAIMVIINIFKKSPLW